jgi:sorbitol-specific phosphotransferase system component IIBC
MHHMSITGWSTKYVICTADVQATSCGHRLAQTLTTAIMIAGKNEEQIALHRTTETQTKKEADMTTQSKQAGNIQEYVHA